MMIVQYISTVNPNFRKPPPANRRLSREENRLMRMQALRQSAIQCVARYDIEGATVEKICDEAGVSRGLIAHYFESKELLLLDALHHWFDSALSIKLQIAKRSGLSAEQRLIEIANSSFAPAIYSWEMAAAWQAFTNASRHNAAYATPIRDASKAIKNLLTRLFVEAAAESHKAIDAKTAALGLMMLDDGLWNSLATGKDHISVKQAKLSCKAYIYNSLR